jgi:hypothetical protein
VPEPGSVSEVRESTPEEDNFQDDKDDIHDLPNLIPPETDGFGTFEGAGDGFTQSDPWAPSHQGSSQLKDTGEWGKTWKEPDDVPDDNEPEHLDEWELANRQKEVQDHYVVRQLFIPSVDASNITPSLQNFWARYSANLMTLLMITGQRNSQGITLINIVARNWRILLACKVLYSTFCGITLIHNFKFLDYRSTYSLGLNTSNFDILYKNFCLKGND